MSQGFVLLDQIYLLETYLDLLQQEGVFLIFQRKDRAKSFPTELFPLPQTLALYLLSRVAKITTRIVLHGPLWRNFPENISPPFR